MPAKSDNNGATIDFEAKLFVAADKLRKNMEPSDYKHIVLGLVFLRHVSLAFEAKHAELKATESDAEDKDEYMAENIFWVPKKSRWSHLQDNARQNNIGKLIDNAMDAIEKDNKSLKGVLPKIYNRENLDKLMLGDLIDLISGIAMKQSDGEDKDLLGRVYEYFLGEFAGAEGKRGGEFYTPRSVVGVLVEILAPYKGRVYDPCCGSGGMFVQSEKFISSHGGRINNISIYGQESNNTTWKLCKMNLAVRHIEANICWNNEGSFHKDCFPDERFDYILANPPFNISDWGGERLRDDWRWHFGIPPTSNANYAWLQHIYAHLRPGGIAGVVLSNGSMSSQTDEKNIRQAMITQGAVDCMIALPSNLFYSTSIPACLWFLTNKRGGKKTHDRNGEVLFIDARQLGEMINKTLRELSTADIAKIANTYHAWKNGDNYKDIAGFCKSATQDEIASCDYILTPGRYVGAEVEEDDGVLFADKMQELSTTLGAQMQEAKKLDAAIIRNLKSLEVEK